jgi:nucleosome binding factor SPN SPT16 subunit
MDGKSPQESVGHEKTTTTMYSIMNDTLIVCLDGAWMGLGLAGGDGDDDDDCIILRIQG